MSKQFVEGNVYVFVAKKLLNTCKGNKNKKSNNEWAKDINGREVRIRNESSGSAGMFGVSPEWCKCIKNNN